MPRFVILEHDWPALHWDFLLETGPVLRAWRLHAEPGSAHKVPAERSFDHRVHYLDYEGPLSGDRGSVRRWDAGTFDWIVDEPARMEIVLQGEKVVGQCVIACDDHNQWSASFVTAPTE
jgi:hypothetical protein